MEVVMVRHGESAWNKDNRFCGWVDVPLSDLGYEQAMVAGKTLKSTGYDNFDIIYTSLLGRANATVDIIGEQLANDIGGPPASFKRVADWRLNERHYGGLTGFNKVQMAEIYGMKQVMEWRRGFAVSPPPMNSDHPNYKVIGNIYNQWVKRVSVLFNVHDV